jgi:hypothetical protein
MKTTKPKPIRPPEVSRKLSVLTGLALAVVAMTSQAAARDIAVVVHKSASLRNVALADFVKMARTTRKWPDGRPLILVIKDPGAPDMRLVNQKLLGKRADEVRALIAANRDLFVVVSTDAEVINTVSQRSNAVGFIDIYSITAAVNILKIDGRPPLEPGYVLWEPSDHGDS